MSNDGWDFGITSTATSFCFNTIDIFYVTVKIITIIIFLETGMCNAMLPK